MSKYVKQLMIQDFRQRLDGVQDALLVNVVGLDANATVTLRRQLRDKDMHLLVVKNSLAQQATEGTPLAAAMHQMEGSLAFVWGGPDIVSLAKEVIRLHEDKQFGSFEARGGVMEGEQLSAERVKEISKWPSREEQLSLLVGQILGPGSQLNAALLGPGAALASQIKSKADAEQEAEQEAAGDSTADAAG